MLRFLLSLVTAAGLSCPVVSHATNHATASNPAAWDAPAIRGAWRHYFQMRCVAREEGVTSRTLALLEESARSAQPARRLAAMVVAADLATTPLLTTQELEALRDESREMLLRDDIGWGRQPLLNAWFHGGDESGIVRELLGQFPNDSVPLNGSRAGDFLHDGLRFDPAHVLPLVVEHWESLERAGRARTQQGMMTAALLLVHATRDDARAPLVLGTWQLTAATGHSESLASYRQLSPRTQDAVRQAAAAWSLRWRSEDDWQVDQEFRSGVRALSWHLIEQIIPVEQDILRGIMASPDSNSTERHRALFLWLARDESSLLHPHNHSAIVSTFASRSWIHRVFLLAVSPTAQPQHEYWQNFVDKEHALRGELQELFYSPVGEIFPPGWRVSPATRMALLEIVAGGLRDSIDPWRQIALSQVLLSLEHEAAYPDVARALVSNFIDDDTWSNASDASWMLGRTGEAGIEAAAGGFRAAIDNGDWQLLDRSAAALMEWGESDFDPAEHADAIELMLEQLADDEVEGNAAAAKRYLRACGPAVVPHLRQLLTDSQDAQQVELCARLLGELEGD